MYDLIRLIPRQTRRYLGHSIAVGCSLFLLQVSALIYIAYFRYVPSTETVPPYDRVWFIYETLPKVLTTAFVISLAGVILGQIGMIYRRKFLSGSKETRPVGWKQKAWTLIVLGVLIAATVIMIFSPEAPLLRRTSFFAAGCVAGVLVGQFLNAWHAWVADVFGSTVEDKESK